MILDVLAFLALAFILPLRRRVVLHLRVVSLLIFLCHFVETLLLFVGHGLRTDDVIYVMSILSIRNKSRV